MTTSFPATAIDSFPSQADLANDTLATKAHSHLHANLGDAVAALQAKVGINNSASSSSLDFIIDKIRDGTPYNVCQGIPAASIGPVLPSNSAATNTTNMQAMLGFGIFGAQNFVFPPGTYPMNGITLAYSGQRLYGFDNVSSVLEYHGTGAGNAFISITGPADSFNGRTNNSGLQDLTLTNSGTADSIGLKITNGTHHRFKAPRFINFQRSALWASNFADSTFDLMEAQGCGGFGADTPVIDFNGSQTAWAVDAVNFRGIRMEGCGDMLYSAVNGNGNYVGKVTFTDKCKFESGGQMGGTESQFHLENSTVVFDSTDWTLQNLRGGQTTIPAAILLKGTSVCQISNSKFNLGGGGTKLFTYLIDIEAANSVLVATNFLVDSEMTSTGAMPTNIVRAQNTPTTSFSGCGYSGGWRSHTPPTWLTGSVQALAYP